MLRKIALAVFGFCLAAGAAFALTVPATFAPRSFPTQQTHYLRFTVNYNSCVLVSNTCNFKVGAVPYNAWIVRAYQQINTSFNSGSTDTIGIGTNTTGVNLVAAQSVHGSAGGSTALTVVAANAGTTITGAGTTPSGADGGFDIYVVYTQSGAAPSAGTASYVIEYFGPNDGSCTTPTFGGTAIAC